MNEIISNILSKIQEYWETPIDLMSADFMTGIVTGIFLMFFIVLILRLFKRKKKLDLSSIKKNIESASLDLRNAYSRMDEIYGAIKDIQ